MKKVNAFSVLYLPIHYILDAQNPGSEFSWSYEIYKHISKLKEINPLFITGGTRKINDSRVISCGIFNPAKLNLSILNVIYFYFKIFFKGMSELRKKRFDIIHHVLPFSGNSFNLLALFSIRKFVVGPVQPALLLQDEDIDIGDSLGFGKEKSFDIFLFLSKIILNLTKPVFRLLSRATLKKADKIIVVNNYTKNEILKMGISEKKIIIIPPGIDTNKFKIFPQEKKRKDKMEIIVVASLRKRKGVDLVILALFEVVKKYKNVHLSIIGDGPQKDVLIQLVNELLLEEYVSFEGFIPQGKIVNYYAKSHIFVNMSKAEGFATVCLEAMASGIAVVSSKVGGFMDVITDSVDGFLVDCGDYLSLSKKITYLIENPELTKKIGERARKKIEAKYDWEKRIIPQYKNLYFSLYE